MIMNFYNNCSLITSLSSQEFVITAISNLLEHSITSETTLEKEQAINILKHTNSHTREVFPLSDQLGNKLATYCLLSGVCLLKAVCF